MHAHVGLGRRRGIRDATGEVCGDHPAGKVRDTAPGEVHRLVSHEQESGGVQRTAAVVFVHHGCNPDRKDFW
jgi:hypothetical protein